MDLLQEDHSFIKIATRADKSSGYTKNTLQSDKQSLPEWIIILQKIYTEEISPSETRFSALDRCLQDDDPIPFEEFFLSFIRFARKKLQDKLRSKNIVVSDSVHAGLERHLLQMMSHLAGKCLELEYSLFRLKQDPFQLFLHEKYHKDLYRGFTKYYTSIDGFLQFFLEYSTLARLLVLHIQQWLIAYEDLLTHWQADLPAIEQAFFHGETLGMLTNIQPGNSDPHHGGRTVCILTFSTGQKIVYKPKNLDIDLAFFSLLRWLDAHSLSAMFKIPSILSRTTYGWMEFVAPAPCKTQQEVQEYYHRAGVLLCLVYALEGIDCHAENVIASGSYPVLIDLETLFHQHVLWPEYRDASRHSGPSQQHDWQPSLLNTGFLPLWLPKDQQVRNIGGLGGGVYEFSESTLLYKNINTDAMVLESGDKPIPLHMNIVRLGTKIMEPSAYIEYILAGFKDMYAFLGEHGELLCATGPLMDFIGCTTRFVFRRTQFYAMLLSRLSHPDYLRDAAKRWQELDVLKQQPALSSGDEALKQKIAEAEFFSLQRLDIPLFSVKIGGNDLETDAGIQLSDFFPQSVFELVKKRIRNLDDENLQRQSSFLRSALLTTAPDEWQSDTEELVLSNWPTEQKQIKSDHLVTVAYHLAEQIKLHTVIGESGSPTWLGLKKQDEHIEFAHVGSSLFDGSCGITLFLATLEYIMQGASSYRDLIIAALHPLCVNLKQTDNPWFESYWDKVGIGGALGLGSMVYALCRIGQALDDAELLACAHRAALLITERRIQADHSLDVIWGSAGAILGLLKLYNTTHDKEILQRAILCGTHLINKRVKTYPGGRSWKQPEGDALTGFSHGVAGIAYALLCLYEVTEQEEFYQTAEEALGYERYVFEQDTKNWSYSKTQEKHFGNSWCHGAPGIGLARLGNLSVLNTPLIHQEIAIALETTQGVGLQRGDNLCCGNFGRLELLLTASEYLNRPALFDLATQQAAVLVQRAEQHGGMFHLRANFPRETFTPDLFQGIAGIGFQLLRVAYPEKVPSILLWK